MLGLKYISFFIIAQVTKQTVYSRSQGLSCSVSKSGWGEQWQWETGKNVDQQPSCLSADNQSPAWSVSFQPESYLQLAFPVSKLEALKAPLMKAKASSPHPFP